MDWSIANRAGAICRRAWFPVLWSFFGLVPFEFLFSWRLPTDDTQSSYLAKLLKLERSHRGRSFWYSVSA